MSSAEVAVNHSFLALRPQAYFCLLMHFSHSFLLTSVSRKRRRALFFLMFFRRRDTATLRTKITTMNSPPITPAAIRGVLGRRSGRNQVGKRMQMFIKKGSSDDGDVLFPPTSTHTQTHIQLHTNRSLKQNATTHVLIVGTVFRILLLSAREIHLSRLIKTEAKIQKKLK